MTDVEKKKVVVTSALPADTLLEALKKAGKECSYVGTQWWVLRFHNPCLSTSFIPLFTFLSEHRNNLKILTADWQNIFPWVTASCSGHVMSTSFFFMFSIPFFVSSSYDVLDTLTSFSAFH